MTKIKVLILKEWSEVFRNKLVLTMMILTPLLFALLPTISIVAMNGIEQADQPAINLDDAGEYYDIPEYFIESCGNLSGNACMQYFLVSQFLMLFMMIPVILPSTFASYSIVGEKTTHTLEPLLATPIKTVELLIGKILAAFIPAILATILSYGIFILSLLFTASGTGIIAQVLSPMWLGAIFGVGGLLSIAGVCVAIMISSRANDPRVAEQLSGFLVIPFVGLMLGQSFGIITINKIMVLWFILIAIVFDAILLYITTQFFDRETILTRWK